MPSQAAPWLEDLDEDWEQPVSAALRKPYTQPIYDHDHQKDQPKSLSRYDHDHQKLQLKSLSRHDHDHHKEQLKSSSRIPRKSSGASSSPSNSSIYTSQRRRAPLTELKSSLTNTNTNTHEHPANSKLPVSRSVSQSLSTASAGSVVRYDTVERRSNSNSPNKQQQTLEWKKRLIDGELGYGDQTDLFAPSGLESMFQSPSRPTTANSSQPLRPFKNLFNQNIFPPSSPPPWPSQIETSQPSSPALPQAPHTSSLHRLQEEWNEDDEEDQQQEEEWNEDDAEEQQQEEEWNEDDEEEQQQEEEDTHRSSNHQAPLPETSPYHLPLLSQHAANHLLPQPSSCRHANRLLSGQTDYSGEAFSPVFISKHTTQDGRVDYATLDSKAIAGLRSDADISDLSIKHQQSDNATPTKDHQEIADFSEMPTAQEVSLPENLPTGTPPAPELGEFVSTKRGGLSMQGSFRTRPLSPSQSMSLRQSSTNIAIEEDDSQVDATGTETQPSMLSPNYSPDRPETPAERDQSTMLSPLPRTRPSTSPLKLFGNYDTFTNNRLLRRMSQLEDIDQHATESDNVDGPSEVSSVIHPQSSTRHGNDPEDANRNQCPQGQVVTRLSSFGEGVLDDHDFEADLSIPTGLNFSEADSFDGSPPPDIAPPGSRAPKGFQFDDTVDAYHHNQQLKRKLSKRSTTKSTVSTQYTSVRGHGGTEQPSEIRNVSEGKRSRTSPTKSPMPKRRRTIVAMNGFVPQLGHGSQIQVKITGASTQSSRTASLEDNETINRTRRNLTRPRNPTPGQNRENRVHDEIDEATLNFLSSSPNLEAVKEKLELTDIPEESLTAEHARSVAAEVAAYTLKRSRQEPQDKRNRSITTQDFLDEAMHIMSLIRARGRPRSGLGNVEESIAEEAYGSQLQSENPLSPSPSPLRLSRPPSREGGSTGWRTRGGAQNDDARVISQLRKFQEHGDDLDLVESSLRSLRVDDDDQSVVTNIMSNVRIRGPRSETDRHHDGDIRSMSRSPTKTHVSNPSLDSSGSRRTIGTHSTRKSDNVATLAPETVAHLIPEEVGGMTFDKEQQKWVRKSTKSMPRVAAFSPTPTSNITSDDDPFDDIPDLTVDEMKEMTRIGLSPTKETSLFDRSAGHMHEQDSRVNSNETVIARPETLQFASSTAQSKYSIFESSKNFGSSRQQTDSRATSWGDGDLSDMNHFKRQSEHDYLDPRGLRVQHPISDISERAEEEEDQSEEGSLDDASVTEELPLPKHRQQEAWFQSSPSVVHSAPTRQISLRRQTLHKGIHANVQDQSEMSFIATLPDKRLVSVSVNLSRSHVQDTSDRQGLAVPSSSPRRMDATFLLSDLPDFTVHEEDHERSSEKILAKRVADYAAKDRFGMAVQSLVKTLTDVEPDEPFWEDIKQLSLRERDLSSVHNLEDFCPRLEDLDLSNNNIAHLEGAPHSIRRLNVRSNALSSLTAWSHLMNLQYLDISGNSIDNLAGLSMLYHLREVRADDNQISSLDGILGLDGLIKLSVRGNQIASVDFEGCELQRLEELDLGGNQITTMALPESLPRLTRLVLDNNELQEFVVETAASQSRLVSLSLHNNQLRRLELSRLSSLRYLNVDENNLATILGLSTLFNLDTLSMRSQRNIPSLTLFTQPLHIRSLYLSSNPIPTLDLPYPYHSIQNLELSACGLQSLPLDFGLRFPNLLHLNLAFNALKDIRPLVNLPMLRSLDVAGNRLARLRKTMATLAELKSLRSWDARSNPLTLGFYPPSSLTTFPTTSQTLTLSNQETSLVHHGGQRSANNDGWGSVAGGGGAAEDAQTQIRSAKRHVLGPADEGADREYLGRLDEEAKLMRRVYEIFLGQAMRKTCAATAESDAEKEKEKKTGKEKEKETQMTALVERERESEHGLVKVDGLPFKYTSASCGVRDEIWERLVELGVLKPSVSGRAE